jgi:hypothetical protein
MTADHERHFPRIQQQVPENSTLSTYPGNSESDSARELAEHLGQHVANWKKKFESYIKVVLGCRATKPFTMNT